MNNAYTAQVGLGVSTTAPANAQADNDGSQRSSDRHVAQQVTAMLPTPIYAGGEATTTQPAVKMSSNPMYACTGVATVDAPGEPEYELFDDLRHRGDSGHAGGITGASRRLDSTPGYSSYATTESPQYGVFTPSGMADSGAGVDSAPGYSGARFVVARVQ